MKVAAIINSGASTIQGADHKWLSDTLEQQFGECGHTVSVSIVEGGDMEAAMKRALDDPEIDTLLAGGGDGTISMAAGMAAERDKALAVIPGGNMNLFARALGIPLDLEKAIAALGHGSRVKVDIAYANGRPFIHEFSLGLHPEMIEERDKQKFGSRIGKLIGSMRSLTSVVARPPRVRVQLDDGKGDSRTIVTPALAISNNPLGEGHFPYPDTLDSGKLGVYILRAVEPAEVASMTARLSLGRWRDIETLEFFTADEVTLRRRRVMKAAVDGELVRMKPPVHIEMRPRGLTVVVPRDEDAVRGQ